MSDATMHTSLRELFTAIRDFVREHPGATVTSVDDSMELLIGWQASTVEGDRELFAHHAIRLGDLKREIALLDANDPLSKELPTVDGRQRIAESLARPLPPPSELRE